MDDGSFYRHSHFFKSQNESIWSFQQDKVDPVARQQEPSVSQRQPLHLFLNLEVTRLEEDNVHKSGTPREIREKRRNEKMNAN